ncbi:hypothetical protein QFC22_002287 [Naganishia vaughanmartiniae]|uniref:Uncharacterized protein n=1 Tax=Naganishia vaughanmartiniae TaxID=1424756 RepID=A0ACC2XG19_9TREE|nr:hypothetical protein QFC22_002287 [Naganishia vaughanmartiniae]
MASICRDSRRTVPDKRSEVSKVLPSIPLQPPVQSYTTSNDPEKGLFSTLEFCAEKDGRSEELDTGFYIVEKTVADTKLPLGGNCTRRLKKRQAARSRTRYIAQFAASFGVTWIILNAITGSHPSAVTTVGDMGRRVSEWKSSVSILHRHLDKPLRPLSDRAKSIKDRCESLPPFPDEVYRTRISRVQEELRKIAEEKGMKEDGLESSSGEIYIMEPGASSTYYAGISAQDWHISERPFLLLIEHQQVADSQNSASILTILTPAFEASRAKLLDLPGMEKDTEVHFIEWKEEEDWAHVLVRHLNGRNGSIAQGASSVNLHFDPAVRTFIPAGIARAAATTQDGDTNLALSVDVADARILSVRERKSAEEIAVLKCGNQLTLEAIKATRDAMFFGIKESQTASILSRYFKELGMPGGEGLVLFGENAALPHGTGTDRALKEDDFALIDAGGQFRGYTSDITRTFALPGSKISATEDRLWHLVKDAQTAALKAGNAGATGKEVDAAARDLIRERGTRKAERQGFTHRLGELLYAFPGSGAVFDILLAQDMASG